MFHLLVYDAHRGAQSPLLPRTPDAKWFVLTPLGGDQKWVPVETVTAEQYIEANDPEMIGILLDTKSDQFTWQEILSAARSLPSCEGIGVAMAFYDLDGPVPHFFIPQMYLDSIEDSWGFEMEIPPIRKRSFYPTYEMLLRLFEACERPQD